ncbi:MAG: universal stress protein [Gammaproteobacteria bacterium]|nr:universal stress protein [Gammaproteobacteria bacterium]
MTNFKSILCVVDIRDDCMAAVERAVTLAENNQASLTVVDVVDRMTAGIGMPVGGPISADLQSAIEASHAQELETLIDPYRQQIPIKTEVRHGIRFLEVIRQVLSDGHDLVIKVPEKLAWLDRLFGSDDMNLLRECPCPVWLVKPQTEKPCRRILAAVDVDDAYPPAEMKSRQALNQQILKMSTSLALSDFAELHVVHVWHAIGESTMGGAFMRAPEAEIVAYVEQVRRRHETRLNGLMRGITDTLDKDAAEYINPRTHLVKGWARKEIPALAKQLAADVIVMGTVARTGVPGFIMGNTAETILNQIDCSVLAIKPPGFKTPVTVEESAAMQ